MSTSPVNGWFQEMQRRRVFRVLAMYVAVAWAATEIISGVGERLGAPDWILTGTVVAFLVGFPVALLLAWVFDRTPTGTMRVPTRRVGLLVVSLAMAVLVSITASVTLVLTRSTTNSGEGLVPRASLVMAILPFADLSPGQELGFMGRAIAEDVLFSVARIPEVTVKGTVSSFALENAPPGTIARELGINRLITGTVDRQGELLRISATVLDPVSGEKLWAEVFSDSLANVFELEERIAHELAAGMGRVHPDDPDAVTRRVDPEAYRLYLQARERMVNPFRDIETTVEHIEQALALDPGFAEALYFRGFLDIGRAWIMEDRQSPMLHTGREYVRRALDINPEMPEAYATLALAHALQYQWMDSRRMADRALEGAGSRPLTPLFELAYNNLGHPSRSHRIANDSFERDPLNPLAMRHMLEVYAESEDDESALQMARLLDEKGLPYQPFSLAGVYARSGRIDDAAAAYAETLNRFGLDESLGANATNALLTGRDPELAAAAEEALAAGTLPLGNAVWLLMNAGADEDRVFELANRARLAGKLNPIAFFTRQNTRYRSDARFVALMDDIGLTDYWRRIEPPDFCRYGEVESVCPGEGPSS